MRLVLAAYALIGGILYLSTLVVWVTGAFGKTGDEIYEEVSNTFFEALELAVFYMFFKRFIRRKPIKQFLAAYLIIFLSIAVAFLGRLLFPGYSLHQIYQHSYLINVFEFIALSVMSLIYFYELFIQDYARNLLKRSSFFIATSTFFYSVLMIPFFVIAPDVSKINHTFFLIFVDCHYLLLIILLLSICKGFLSRTRITA
jgi:hypothetical protein